MLAPNWIALEAQQAVGACGAINVETGLCTQCEIIICDLVADVPIYKYSWAVKWLPQVWPDHRMGKSRLLTRRTWSISGEWIRKFGFQATASGQAGI